jgi:two-component system, NarL family, response regulator YdfI
MSVETRFGDKKVTSVFIVAASDVVRAGLQSLIGGDGRFTVAGTAADLSVLARQRTEHTVPDVVIVDVERQAEGAANELQTFVDEAAESGDSLALVVIGAGQSEWVSAGLRAGVVKATLARTASGSEIIAALEAVAAGLAAFDAETLTALLSPQIRNPGDSRLAESQDEPLPPVERELDALTTREREVLEMLAEGLSNKEIAWRMKISDHTVKFHVASIFAKLDVSTRTEAVMQGIRRGLVMM